LCPCLILVANATKSPPKEEVSQLNTMPPPTSRARTRRFDLALAIILILPLFGLFAPAHPSRAASANKLGVNLAGFYDLPHLKAAAGAVGEWGYVGVVVSPEQAPLLSDFLLNCYSLHLTPILRLAATQSQPSQPWPRPSMADALNWANILNNLDWHNLPRIIAVGNEMNLFSEWGGTADPAGYDDYLVTLARTLRATSNPDAKYTILMGAITLGAPDLDGVAMSPMTFIAQMKQHMPDVFNYIDGTAINIYAIRPYTDLKRWNIFGYKLQQQLMGKTMPVYILETGLDPHFPYTDQDSADFLRLAWPDWQSDPTVVTAMPLTYVPKEYIPQQAGDQPFWFFHLNDDGSLLSVSRTYAAMADIAKQPDHTPVLTDQERLIRSFWPADPPTQPGVIYFPEVKHNLDRHFVAAWQQGGGLAMFGYPLHEAAIQGGNLVQYTERARFEFHPSAGQPCCDSGGTLEFGLLGREAMNLHQLSYPPATPAVGYAIWGVPAAAPTPLPTATPLPNAGGTRPPAPPIPPAPTGLYFNESKHNLSGKFLDYWQTHGGLATFGYPLSEPLTLDGLTIQYFERARMEAHPEGVELGRLGYEVARSFDYKGYW
jgi:hypothetical protein